MERLNEKDRIGELSDGKYFPIFGFSTRLDLHLLFFDCVRVSRFYRQKNKSQKESKGLRGI